jgi:hypothetical protein
VFYQLQMADAFDKDAQVDQPHESRHARGLASAFLASCVMTATKTASPGSAALVRGIADAAPMAALTSVVFHNSPGDSVAAGNQPYPKRQWLLGKDYFLRGLLICAGRRHALRIEGSGCQPSRSSDIGRARSSSFTEWDVIEGEIGDSFASAGLSSRVASARSRVSTAGRRRGANKPSIFDFQNALRPMITFYAIMDQISAEFTLNMDDVQVQESSERLARTIEDCQRARSIHELLDRAKVTFEHDEMIDLLQKGMVVA